MTRVTHDFTVSGAASVDAAWARAQQERDKPSSQVTVYHSPDGTRSVLLPSLSARVRAWLVLPGLVALIGAGLLCEERPSLCHPT
ncbi:hypothetical protein E7T06_04965 [Deinococcus sp. Arct2-2]|uniref:hypothetical protein n=1 Tax=Deinococcus sp. Arct2-2 TaxID=2568653 RepID=UPI0010A2EF21|nr:hypothetical protein [Deinococcus sp. Arct2-2]THF70913.1 hypothetical protein E7T06_04965 [Deinococcus sp. Arct2-2]